MNGIVGAFAKDFHTSGNCASETTPQLQNIETQDIASDYKRFAQNLDAYLCERLCISLSEFHSYKRNQWLCRPRHVGIYLLTRNGHSIRGTALMYKRTWKTAQSSIARCEALYIHDAEFRRLYDGAVSFMRGLGWRFNAQIGGGE